MSQAGNADMEKCVRLDEANIAVAVIGTMANLGESIEFPGGVLVNAFSRRQFRTSTFNRRAILVDFIQVSYGHVANEVSPLWHDPQKVFLLQTDGGFADRGAAALVPAG